MRSRSYLHPFIVLLLVLLYYYYYIKVAQIVILSCFRPVSNSILVKNGTFSHFKLVCDGVTDGWTDGQTDGRTHPLIEMRERILKDGVEMGDQKQGRILGRMSRLPLGRTVLQKLSEKRRKRECVTLKPINQPTDGPTKWSIESRARNLKRIFWANDRAKE